MSKTKASHYLQVLFHGVLLLLLSALLRTLPVIRAPAPSLALVGFPALLPLLALVARAGRYWIRLGFAVPKRRRRSQEGSSGAASVTVFSGGAEALEGSACSEARPPFP